MLIYTLLIYTLPIQSTLELNFVDAEVASNFYRPVNYSFACRCATPLATSNARSVNLRECLVVNYLPDRAFILMWTSETWDLHFPISDVLDLDVPHLALLAHL